MHLHPFIHYFEIFVGSNAAIAGFQHTRSHIYDFYINRAQHQFDYKAKKVFTGLTLLPNIINTMLLLHPQLNPPVTHKKAQEVYDKFIISHKSCRYKLGESRLSCKNDEKIIAEKRVLPWLIYCLLYCVMLVLLCGFQEEYEHVFSENRISIFLLIFNLITLGGYITMRIYYRLISFVHQIKKHFPKLRINENLFPYESKYLARYNKYHFVRKHMVRFLYILGSSILISFGLYKLHFKHLPMWLEVLVLFLTLIICAFPLFLLIACAIKWKLKSVSPILKEFKQECVEPLKIVDNCDVWYYANK